MARLGAKVTGIDASKKNIEIAKHHLKKVILVLSTITILQKHFHQKISMM